MSDRQVIRYMTLQTTVACHVLPNLIPQDIMSMHFVNEENLCRYVQKKLALPSN